MQTKGYSISLSLNGCLITNKTNGFNDKNITLFSSEIGTHRISDRYVCETHNNKMLHRK